MLRRSPFRKRGKPIARRALKKAVRQSREARRWSRAVLERDEYRCQWPGGCFTGDDRIDPHHKAKRSQRPDLKYNVDIGIALCRTHHIWTDYHHDEAVAMGLLDLESYELAAKRRRAA